MGMRLLAVFFFALAPALQAQDAVGREISPWQPGMLLITEVMVNPPLIPEADYEWVEIWNPGATPLSLDGCALVDNVRASALPAGVTIAPGAYLVIAAGPGFTALYPGFSGHLVYLADGRIGNGLANDTDFLALRCGATVLDQVGWGSGIGGGSASAAPAQGQTLVRRVGLDALLNGEGFAASANPSPGGPATDPRRVTLIPLAGTQ